MTTADLTDETAIRQGGKYQKFYQNREQATKDKVLITVLVEGLDTELVASTYDSLVAEIEQRYT